MSTMYTHAIIVPEQVEGIVSVGIATSEHEAKEFYKLFSEVYILEFNMPSFIQETLGYKVSSYLYTDHIGEFSEEAIEAIKAMVSSTIMSCILDGFDPWVSEDDNIEGIQVL